MRAIVGPVISTKFRTIPRNTRIRAIPRNGILIGNPNGGSLEITLTVSLTKKCTAGRKFVKKQFVKFS